MADKTVTINPIGGDYTTLSAAIAGELITNPDLTASGLDGILTLSIEGDWDGSPDTIEVDISGFTMDATHYLIIKADSSNKAIKTGIDTSRYILSITDPSIAAFQIRDDYVRLDGLQIHLLYSASSYKIALRINDQSTSNDIRIENCYIQGPLNSSSGATGVSIVSSDVDGAILSNNIVRGFDEAGIRVNSTNNLIYNNVLAETTGDGFFLNTSSTGTIKNNAIFNNNDDFDIRGTFTIDYNASDDGDGTNAISPSGSDWANEFPNYSTGDFTVVSTGNLFDSGVGPSSDANVPTTDMDGNTRSGTTTDIGVDEYQTAPTTNIPVTQNYLRQRRAG